MPRRKSPPRLSVEITRKQKRELDRLLPHGMKKKIFSEVIDDLIELLDGEEPKKVLGAMKKDRLNPEDYIGGVEDL